MRYLGVITILNNCIGASLTQSLATTTDGLHSLITMSNILTLDEYRDSAVYDDDRTYVGNTAASTAAPDIDDDALQELVEADDFLTSSDVLARIEETIAKFVEDVAGGVVPTMQLVSRGKSNVCYQPQYNTSGVGDDTEDAAPGGSSRGVTVGLKGKVQTRSLIQNQGQGAYAFVRVFKLMEAIHDLLRSGKQATQRDLYYKLLGPPIFNNSREVDLAIQDVVAMLRVPRSCLGISCAPRGAVSGKLYVKDNPTSPWQDCTSCGLSGKSIPGDPTAIAGFTFQCSARYLLVVEKDAIFQRLNEDRFFDTVPSVIITARGMPDLATRAFAAHLLASFPHLTVLGLVDYNPAGVTILKTYKYGSHRMGLESHRYALPSLRWLGLRSNMLEDVEEQHLQRLTQRDRAMLPRLKEVLSQHEPSWLEELQVMEDSGWKADIEAVYSVDGFQGLAQMLARSILRKDYL